MTTDKKQNGTEQAQAKAHPLTELLTLVRQMSNRLEAIASQTPPDWQLPLSYYRADWPDRIGAKVIQTDTDGPAKVVWCGHIYTRRTGAKKYGVSIWYSRKLRGNGDSEDNYGRLITFQNNADAEPLPDYVRAELPPPPPPAQ